MILIEIIAALLTLISAYQAKELDRNTWYVGGLASIFYALIFIHQELYGLFLFQGFCIVQAIQGHIEWKKLNVNSAKLKDWFLFSLLTPVGCVVAYSHEGFKLLDFFITAFSFGATYLLIKGKRESWYIWGLVNVISVFLFIKAQLWISTVTYILLLINSIFAIWKWRKNGKTVSY